MSDLQNLFGCLEKKCGDIKNEAVVDNIITNKKLISNNTEAMLKQSTMSKSELGQFYTTNYEYILSNMKIPNNVKKSKILCRKCS